MSRYAEMFARLEAAGEGAFIPFIVIGDPSLLMSFEILDGLMRGNPDALELGIPFSDPVADGPAIQAAAARALATGTTLANCWLTVSVVRKAHPSLPIGLLVYANLVFHRGIERFYAEAAAAGADSVLVADLPVAEAAPFIAAAHAAGIDPVFIAPPNADDDRLAAIAAASRGYTYVVTRSGVTGVDGQLQQDSSALLARLAALGAPPPVLGFGIGHPDQVRAGLAMGARGVISGSAVVQLVDRYRNAPGRMHGALTEFVEQMKAATR